MSFQDLAIAIRVLLREKSFFLVSVWRPREFGVRMALGAAAALAYFLPAAGPPGWIR